MKLRDVLLNVPVIKVKGDLELDCENITFDSRKVGGLNTIFVCLKGENTDGHLFALDAVKNGAKVIVCERELGVCDNEIVVESSRKTFALLASNFYGNAHKRLKMIAITGTNGKTTTTYMIKSILENFGAKVGLIGTEGAFVCGQYFSVNLTTPDPMELNRLFKIMYENGCEYCVMEASAHALYHDKLYGINFDVGIFSNFTQDHLDFFKNMDNYSRAKLKLFNENMCKIAVLNFDDELGREIADCSKIPVISYAIESPADCFVIDIAKNYFGSKFVLNLMDNISDCEINLPGKYNIYNALSAAAATIALGVDIKNIVRGLKALEFVSGRFNSIPLCSGAHAIIDFAHTPDGMKNILTAIKELNPKRLITVFGCGGNRDQGKREQMGAISESLSDFSILTSDNPRFENPELILSDIECGFLKDKFISVVNREKAIEIALNLARKGDIVAILGKGAEKYQDINGMKVPYCDIEIVKIIDEKIATIKSLAGV